MTYHDRRHAWTAAVLLVLAGCDSEAGTGSETTNDSDGNGDDDGDGDDGCGAAATSVLTDLDAIPSSYQVSPNTLLSYAVGDYTGELSWRPDDGPLTVTHAGTTSALTMAVRYEAGEVRLTEVELAGDFPFGNAGGQPCSNVLEMDVTVDFGTADGVFAETLKVPLRSYSHGGYGYPEQHTPNLDHSVDLEAAGGTISPADFTVTDGEFRDLVLIAEFPEGPTATGTLLVEIQGGPDDGWIGAGDVANFEASKP